jgi:phosphate transport system substrate-binding protein
MQLLYFIFSLFCTFQSGFAAELVLKGAGATLPLPLYAKWFGEFQKQNANVKITYDPNGSGFGIRQILDSKVDFGASDLLIAPAQLAKSKAPILQIPTAIGDIAVAYHIPSVSKTLRFSGELLANIYLGKITSWSDPQIAKLNPGVNFPAMPITVVHRSDASGSSAAFTKYLSSVNPEWKKKVGAGTISNWPVGMAGRGSDSVTALIQQLSGTIGYIGIAYANHSGLDVAQLQSEAGKWTAPAEKKYPISTTTYLLVYQKMEPSKGKTLQAFLRWVLSPSAQTIATQVSYEALPAKLLKSATQYVNEMQFTE